MKSSIRTRVVKSNAVEVSTPRIVDNSSEGFRHLGEHLAVVRNVAEPENEVIHFRSRIKPLGSHSGTNSEESSNPSNDVSFERTEYEASKFPEQTQAQAQDILAQARTEAEQIRVKALNEVADLKERIREEVTAQARAEGYEAGFKQGLHEGRIQAQQEWSQKIKEAQKLVDLAQNAVQEEWAKVDQALLHLVVKLAERVVRVSLDFDPELLLHQIRALTLFPQEHEGWRLHVSPEDFAWLKERELEAELPLTLVSNETLQPGDSFLECAEGIFDARLETQLTRLEKLLREELRHERLEQVGR